MNQIEYAVILNTQLRINRDNVKSYITHLTPFLTKLAFIIRIIIIITGSQSCLFNMNMRVETIDIPFVAVLLNRNHTSHILAMVEVLL